MKLTANEQKLRKSWEREIEFRHAEREQAERDLAALRAENARLLEALQRIINEAYQKDTPYATRAVSIARAALVEQGKA